jgi:hypothetical protein
MPRRAYTDITSRARHARLVDIRCQLATGTDIDRIALAMLAAIQGGLLLSQSRRDTAPLEAALDTVIEHLSRLGAQ